MKIPVIRGYEIKLSSLLKNLLTNFQQIAQESGIRRLALVGGLVRDQLIHEKSEKDPGIYSDIDLIVEVPALELAQAIQLKLGNQRASILQNNCAYQTIEMQVDGFKVDIARARKEIYLKPGHNPQVTPCTIEEDLRRRDFTVNAIALDLMQNKVIDLYNGKRAIIKRQLDFLHDASASDDPTRIFRGARYAARLNLKLSVKALQQIQSTVIEWPWEWKAQEAYNLAPPALSTRLRMELEQIFYEASFKKSIAHLKSWHVLTLLDQGLQEENNWQGRLHWAERFNIKKLTAYIAGARDPLGLASRLQISESQKTILSESLELKMLMKKIYLSKSYLQWSTSHWCNAIEAKSFQKDSVRLAICLRSPLWQYLLRWLLRWSLITSPISGQELIEKGWTQGPSIGKELKKQRENLLDREKGRQQ